MCSDFFSPYTMNILIQVSYYKKDFSVSKNRLPIQKINFTRTFSLLFKQLHPGNHILIKKSKNAFWVLT